MSDLRTRLERLGERVRPAADAFARLERARRRRERNRRIGAGVVALLVAAAGSLAAFSAFRAGEPQQAGGEDGFFALWPESTGDEALAAQRDVETGDSDVQWRLDAEATAVRFVERAMGWADDPADLAVASTASADGLVTVELATPAAPCPSPPVPACLPRDVTVRLRQLVADGGIWSVVSVESPVFNVPLRVGDEVALDGYVAIATGLPDGTDVAVGVAGTGSCTGFDDQGAEVVDGHVVVAVRGVPIGCTGYLYALTPGTPIGFVGSEMFERDGSDVPLDYLITAITAVPVRFVPPAEVPPPSVSVAPVAQEALRVTCDRTAIGVDARSVAAGPRGVHVVVENTSTQPLSLVVAADPQGPVNATPVEPGITELALQPPPGDVVLYCIAEFGEVGTDLIEVEVVDPQALFVQFDLTCPGRPVSERSIPIAAWDHVDPAGAPDPVEFLRSHAQGLLPSDVVEPAGYPEAADEVVRVVREGAVVGAFGEPYRQFGEWTVGGVWCSEIEITIPTPPEPYPRGAFEWCPEPPFGEPGVQWEERASEAAVQFVRAHMNGDQATLNALLDESVPAGADFPIVLAEDAVVVIGTSAAGGEVVRFGCGPDVDAYTVAITIDDGTDSASMDFTVFLVFRGVNGWKVWAVY